MLGIVGAFLAMFVGQAVGWYAPDQGAGFIAAIIGAIVALFIWNRIAAARAARVGCNHAAADVTMRGQGETAMAKRKRHLEPKYVVNIDLKAMDLPKAGVAMILKVKDRTGLLLGTAEIGQGSFGWRPANKQKFERIEWDKLSSRLDGRG